MFIRINKNAIVHKTHFFLSIIPKFEFVEIDLNPDNIVYTYTCAYTHFKKI